MEPVTKNYIITTCTTPISQEFIHTTRTADDAQSLSIDWYREGYVLQHQQRRGSLQVAVGNSNRFITSIARRSDGTELVISVESARQHHVPPGYVTIPLSALLINGNLSSWDASIERRCIQCGACKQNGETCDHVK